MNSIRDEIEIADIVVKKLWGEGNLNQEEKQQLQKWLDASEEHRALFRQIAAGQRLAEFREITELSNQKEQWIRLNQQMQQRNFIVWRKWYAYAAAAVLLIALGLWGILNWAYQDDTVVQNPVIEPVKKQALLILNNGQEFNLRDRDTLVTTDFMSIHIQMGQISYEVEKKSLDLKDVGYNTIIVPRGGIYSLALSDGTKVFLNSDSELRFPAIFTGTNREVNLKGEAFFEVTPDSLHPFIVHARDMQVRVLGTSFNILAYADEPAVLTTLFTGRIEVSVDHSESKRILTPGMQAIWKKGADEIFVKKVNMDTQSLWRDGIIMLEDAELESVMRMLARWYNVDYEWKGSKKEPNTFTGKINRNDNLRTVLNTLTLLGGPYFEIKGKTVYIY